MTKGVQMTGQTAFSPAVLPGVEAFAAGVAEEYRGARAGLVTALSAVDASLEPTLDRLRALDSIRLAALFAPEHGLHGAQPAGQQVEAAVDRRTGLPVHSLYGERKRPAPEQLRGLDLLIIDLPDAGCRFWTFLYTMAYCLEAAAELELQTVVLDRPNPIGGDRIEGNVLDPAFKSFVGMYPIPIRTGLTAGEAAHLFNTEFGIGAPLRVVRCEGWNRRMHFPDTGLPFVPPSPNTPTYETLALYPGTCLVEGTNVSEGRGTAHPFRIAGAPWIDGHRLAADLNERGLPGVRFRPVHFVPTASKHQGSHCQGVYIHILDPDPFSPVEVGVHLLHALKHHDPSSFEWLRGEPPFIDLLAGADQLRLRIDAGDEPDEILRDWDLQRREFAPIWRRALLYPNEEREAAGMG